MQKIERDLWLLKSYAGVMTLVCGVLFVLIFRLMASTHFEEISAERINILEKDGKLRMVLSNQQRQHPGAMDGITFQDRQGQRPPGMIFLVKMETKWEA